MTRGDCDSNLKDDERTLELFKKQDVNEVDDFELKNQNQNMKHTEVKDLINLSSSGREKWLNLSELDISYKNELKLEIKSIEEYINYYINILKNVITNKTFMEIDYNYNNSLTSDLIRNKWKGFIYTTNQTEYKDKYDILNSRYSQIKFELIQNNLQLVNCDLLYLVNNLDLISNIWKVLPDTYYHLNNPKLVIIEIDNTIEKFINIVKIGLEKRYTPIVFTRKYIIFIINEYVYKLKNIQKINISKNPYDYLYLYNNIYKQNNEFYPSRETDELYTNEKLIYNTAIRNYCLTFPSMRNVSINQEWLTKNINQYGYQIFNYST